MSSCILANNNFDEYEEIQIVEVDSNSNSCLTFEEQDLNQRGVQLQSTNRTNHFNQISAVMGPNSSQCGEQLKVSDFSEQMPPAAQRSPSFAQHRPRALPDIPSLKLNLIKTEDHQTACVENTTRNSRTIRSPYMGKLGVEVDFNDLLESTEQISCFEHS